jgi:hypothetical protein
MFVTIHHQILDAKQWAAATRHVMTEMEQGKLPAGLKGLMYLPSADGRHADCLWETDTLEHLKRFIEHETGKAAKNEYFRVNDRGAIGLPGAAHPATAADLRTEEAMHLAA